MSAEYVGYVLIRDECGEDEVSYVGETEQNVYTRGLRLMVNYRGKHNDSPLWKHAQMAHGGRTNMSFSMQVAKSFRDPLTRQINEADCTSNNQLNFKTEWHGPATVRLVEDGEGFG